MFYLYSDIETAVVNKAFTEGEPTQITLILKQLPEKKSKNEPLNSAPPPRPEIASTPVQKFSNNKQERTAKEKKSTAKIPSKFHVSKDSIRETLQELLTSDKTRSTDNGATVMDLSLLATLQRNERISDYTQAPGQFPGSSIFEAGSWTDFVDIAGMCFHVKRANPLEAMSRDTWYRTSCK